MTPQPNKIEPLVVMNLFWAWWGRWWSPKVSSFHRHQCPETVWALELQCCCQVSALSPKPFHSTLKHQLNFKLTCSLVAEVAIGTGHLGMLPPPGGVTPRMCWRSRSPQQPLLKTWLFPRPWHRGSHQAWGCWGWPQGSAVSQAPAAPRCTFTYKIWCLHGCLSAAQLNGTPGLGLFSSPTMQILDTNL